jgi:hypothetical protein
MPEKRSEHRQKTVTYGDIISESGLVMSCAIRDISRRGARLTVSTPYWVSDRFNLRIPSRNLTAKAQVRWRKRTEIGVLFIEIALLSVDPGSSLAVA